MAPSVPQPAPENSMAAAEGPTTSPPAFSPTRFVWRLRATQTCSSFSLCGAPHNRKVTNGFRSAWGAAVYADICSIVATGRLNGRTALDAIREALAAGPAAAA